LPVLGYQSHHIMLKPISNKRLSRRSPRAFIVETRRVAKQELYPDEPDFKLGEGCSLVLFEKPIKQDRIMDMGYTIAPAIIKDYMQGNTPAVVAVNAQLIGDSEVKSTLLHDGFHRIPLKGNFQKANSGFGTNIKISDTFEIGYIDIQIVEGFSVDSDKVSVSRSLEFFLKTWNYFYIDEVYSYAIQARYKIGDAETDWVTVEAGRQYYGPEFNENCLEENSREKWPAEWGKCPDLTEL